MKEFICTTIFLLIMMLRYEIAAVDVEYENCKDNQKQTEFCKLLFEKTPQNCHDPGYQGPALNCRVTCKNCEAFNCHNPKPPDVLPCDELARQCTNPTLGPFLQKNCPATCGTCGATVGQLCKDVAPAPTCYALKALCDSHENYEFMTQQCPATCGRCPSTGQCEDTIPNCQEYLSYCNDTRYDDLMRQKCGKTCNKCGSVSVPRIGASDTCVDKPGCPMWVGNGFCSNSGYSEVIKREYCPKSCNLC